MAAEKTDVLLIGPPKAVIVNGLAGPFNLIKLSDAKDPEKLFAETAPRVRAIAVSVPLRARQRLLSRNTSNRLNPGANQANGGQPANEMKEKASTPARLPLMLMVYAVSGANRPNSSPSFCPSARKT
jgi:hypothetical protein